VRFSGDKTMWQSKEEFKARVREWAQKLDVEVRVISMRAMKNKWASYTKKSDLLIFNTELLDMDKELGDYVIVHELLHFRAPNHGKLWKSFMHAHLGDYERLEKQLEVKGM
jgi:predicted metal-dependent hydrolase